MKEGPDISRIAAMIGDPARANILSALIAGQALTAGELAQAAGVTPATTSGHLAQLTDIGLIRQRRQGRHRYYVLTGPEVAETLEVLTGLAAAQGHLRLRPGPRDDALRTARVCYDHLAGARGVQVFDSLARRGFFHLTGDEVALSESGAAFITGFGIDLEALIAGRRPLCRVCLDWSERRSHLGGALGAAMLQRFEAMTWLRRESGSRRLTFTAAGAAAFDAAFAQSPESESRCTENHARSAFQSLSG
jgi:DNA-binding transcriptional ArsR family regulator